MRFAFTLTLTLTFTAAGCVIEGGRVTWLVDCDDVDGVDDDEGDAVDPCAGCVADPCVAVVFVPAAASPTPRLATFFDLTSGACAPQDALPLPEQLRCGGADVVVAWDEATQQPASATSTAALADGVVEVTRSVWVWHDVDRLAHEELVAVEHDGVDTGVHLAWDFVYEGEAVVRVDERALRPGVGPQHNVDLYDVAGHLLTHTLFTGDDDRPFVTAEHHWDGDRYLGKTTTRLDNPDQTPVELVLRYDDDGALVGVTDDGVDRAVSDDCCNACADAAP